MSDAAGREFWNSAWGHLPPLESYQGPVFEHHAILKKFLANTGGGDAIEIGCVEQGIVKMRAAEVGAAQIGLVEICAGEVGAGQVRTRQIGVVKIHLAEIGASEISAGKVMALEIGARQIAAPAIAGTAGEKIRALIGACGHRCQHQQHQGREQAGSEQRMANSEAKRCYPHSPLATC